MPDKLRIDSGMIFRLGIAAGFFCTGLGVFGNFAVISAAAGVIPAGALFGSVNVAVIEWTVLSYRVKVWGGPLG